MNFCECVRERDKNQERECMSVCVSESESENERERERERESGDLSIGWKKIILPLKKFFSSWSKRFRNSTQIGSDLRSLIVCASPFWQSAAPSKYVVSLLVCNLPIKSGLPFSANYRSSSPNFFFHSDNIDKRRRKNQEGFELMTFGNFFSSIFYIPKLRFLISELLPGGAARIFSLAPMPRRDTNPRQESCTRPFGPTELQRLGASFGILVERPITTSSKILNN